MSVNKVHLIGIVGKDPEIKTIGEDMKLASFSLATSEKREGKEYTQWHSIKLWKERAELAEKYIRKGTKLYVEGSIYYREWTTPEGSKRYATEIIGQRIEMLNKVELDSDAPSEELIEAVKEKQEAPANDDDLPF